MKKRTELKINENTIFNVRHFVYVQKSEFTVLVYKISFVQNIQYTFSKKFEEMLQFCDSVRGLFHLS